MNRLLAAVACAMALSLAAPATIEMPAAAAKKAAMKQCKAKALDGKAVTWKCATDQPCCMNYVTGKGVCGTKAIGCL
ncbi:MAG: hypothetical protein ABWZ74_00330 [Hyphomicrobiaceae bacterium]|jgi:uncharacterized low-complexity protein